MSEKPEALWVVEKRLEDGSVISRRLFRTRDAARQYVDSRPSPFKYAIHRATWGPEQ